MLFILIMLHDGFILLLDVLGICIYIIIGYRITMASTRHACEFIPRSLYYREVS